MTFSVVIPTLNEASHVADTVAYCLESGAAEVIVSDSGSTDETLRIAEAAGAVTVRHRTPGASGKGAALSAGVAIAASPVCAFLDADLQFTDAHFVSRLVAPVLSGESDFAKGQFDRLDADSHHRVGRVTLLTALPLLRHVAPDLATIAEPLSGQISGRTSLLRGLRYPSDYGVEVSHLFQLRHLLIEGRMALPYCGAIRHRSQSTEALAVMADQVAFAILREAGVISSPNGRTEAGQAG